MYKIGVLGDRDSIYGFGALGLDVFPVESPKKGRRPFGVWQMRATRSSM